MLLNHRSVIRVRGAAGARQSGPVTVRINNVTFDCADPRALGTFWAGLLGWNVYYDDDPMVVVAPHFPSEDQAFLFIQVPEGKTAKNRVHLDLEPVDCTRDEQVERAVALGARIIGDHRKEDGSGWVTLADPEGNELCVERGLSERAPRTEPRSYRIG
jgi:predicted enzyme related to lactoylglutathione lyase